MPCHVNLFNKMGGNDADCMPGSTPCTLCRSIGINDGDDAIVMSTCPANTG